MLSFEPLVKIELAVVERSPDSTALAPKRRLVISKAATNPGL